MTRAGALTLALLVAGCASSPPPAPTTPRDPQAVSDPRVSELRILVSELVDRMEVMQARMSRMEDVLTQLAAESPAPRQDAPRRVGADGAAEIGRYLSASDAAESYREALVMFGRGQNNEARERFSAVYRTDPAGELADNALYWIGETHFVMNEFREAIRFYDRVVSNFPSQNKAPDALHRKSLALVKLGDLSLAKRTLETLIEQYPYSTAASAARRELERIRY